MEFFQDVGKRHRGGLPGVDLDGLAFGRDILIRRLLGESVRPLQEVTQPDMAVRLRADDLIDPVTRNPEGDI